MSKVLRLAFSVTAFLHSVGILRSVICTNCKKMMENTDGYWLCHPCGRSLIE